MISYNVLQTKEVAEGNLGVGAKYHSLLSAVILLFNGIPQKTFTTITNYTERQTGQEYQSSIWAFQW